MFKETLHAVANRGTPPVSFLTALLVWAKLADSAIFAPNPNKADIYALIAGTLGPWTSNLHREAALLEVMRVHAGFESSWNWEEGVDTTNKTSMAQIEGQETGIFQVSFNSTWLGNHALQGYALNHDIGTAAKFIQRMKDNHGLALDYYARLVRVNIQWAGPLASREILPYLRKAAVAEFQTLLVS